MFCRIARFSVFACQKDATGAALKKAAPALGSGQQKSRLLLEPKSGGSGSETLLWFSIHASQSETGSYLA